jgi:hypothetical protein
MDYAYAYYESIPISNNGRNICTKIHLYYVTFAADKNSFVLLSYKKQRDFYKRKPGKTLTTFNMRTDEKQY